MAGAILGKSINYKVVGQISDTLPLFIQKLDGVTEICVDFSEFTFINSIGVSKWVAWVLKLPLQCQLILVNCPFLIINQINIVHGFMPEGKAKVKSFFAPYYCECGLEELVHCERGRDYAYPGDQYFGILSLPESTTCKKCGKETSRDFDIKKIEKMLQI